MIKVYECWSVMDENGNSTKDWTCELWGASTKHADIIYSMNRDIKNELFRRCQFADDPDHDIFQWLLYVASIQTWKNTAKEIVEIALNEWY